MNSWQPPGGVLGDLPFSSPTHVALLLATMRPTHRPDPVPKKDLSEKEDLKKHALDGVQPSALHAFDRLSLRDEVKAHKGAPYKIQSMVYIGSYNVASNELQAKHEVPSIVVPGTLYITECRV